VLGGVVEGRDAFLEGKEEGIGEEEGEKGKESYEGMAEEIRKKSRMVTASSCWSSL
jgi:hypothetical protein